MHKIEIICTVVILFFLIVDPSHAVYARFNVGVGYGGKDELVISTDSPGEFDYRLYLRTADNTPSMIQTHYNGVDNLSRSFHLPCATDEPNALDNPATGTCISGGPYVRGAFIAGNANQFAVVKRFTLFCGSLQVVGNENTTHWTEDFDNSAIHDFLTHGASSTWCPTTTSVVQTIPSITPTIKSISLTPTIQTSVSSSHISALSPSPSPIQTLFFGDATQTQSKQSTTPLITIASFAIVAVVGYLKRKSIRAFLNQENQPKEFTNDSM